MTTYVDPGFKKETTFMPDGECDRKAGVGDRITVHYTGKLESGEEFDSR